MNAVLLTLCFAATPQAPTPPQAPPVRVARVSKAAPVRCGCGPDCACPGVQGGVCDCVAQRAAALPCGRAKCDCGCADGEPCKCAAAKKKQKACEVCSNACECGCQSGLPCTCEAAARGADVALGTSDVKPRGERAAAPQMWAATPTFGGPTVIRLVPAPVAAPTPVRRQSYYAPPAPPRPAAPTYYQAPPQTYFAPRRAIRSSGC